MGINTDGSSWVKNEKVQILPSLSLLRTGLIAAWSGHASWIVSFGKVQILRTQPPQFRLWKSLAEEGFRCCLTIWHSLCLKHADSWVVDKKDSYLVVQESERTLLLRTSLSKCSRTKCVTTDKHKNRHSCFYPVLICFVSQVQGVIAVITVKQLWFHPIFLSCFNRLFIKTLSQPATALHTLSQGAQKHSSTSQPSPPISVFSPLFMLQLSFSFLLSQGWFPKYDIITQRLSEGSVTHGALQMQLEFDLFKKKNIP